MVIDRTAPPQTFLDQGADELLKGMVHGAVLLLAGACAAYNGLAYRRRPERRLAVNAVLYGALVAWEVWQASRHLRRSPPS